MPVVRVLRAPSCARVVDPVQHHIKPPVFVILHLVEHVRQVFGFVNDVSGKYRRFSVFPRSYVVSFFFEDIQYIVVMLLHKKHLTHLYFPPSVFSILSSSPVSLSIMIA